MRELAFSDEPFNFIAYLVYSTRALKEIYPNLYGDESEVFKDPYLPAIRAFIESRNGLFDMNEQIVAELIRNVGAPIPREIFQESILEMIETDMSHPFNQALAESDLFDWTPEAPVLMLYCPTDDQVPFINSIIADSVMNANGAVSVSSEDVSDGRILDHTDCIVPALNRGIPWLLGFIDTTTPDITIPIEGLEIYPNPASGILTIRSPKHISSATIYDLTGRHLRTRPYNGENILELDVTGLSSGIYLLELTGEQLRTLQKVVIE